jgi:hypothetical protein
MGTKNRRQSASRSGINLFIVLLLLLLFAGQEKVSAQCCSTGSPVGASVYIGVLNRNTLRINTFYRHNYSDTYYAGNEKTTENTSLKYSKYDFASLAFGYGITKRLTVEADFGYFFDKTQVFSNIDYTEKGYGFSNGGITLKYGTWIKPVQQIELTLGAGFRYPFTQHPQEVDGVQLSRDVQPSTNAFSVGGLFFFNKGFPSITLRVFTMNRYDHNFEDINNYKYGDILLNSIFVSKKIVKYFFGILQFRSEYKWPDQDHGETRPNTGNFLLIVSPQLSYSIVGKWNLSVLCDIPVYKDYRGKQLTPMYSYAIALSRDFNFSRKPKADVEIRKN